MFDPEEVKKDFPLLSRRDVVYLDNAATTQKPKQVIEAVKDYYENHYSNVHRGIYTLSEEATDMYEKARENIARFVGLRDASSLVFVRNTTEALNLLSYSLGTRLESGDEILLTEMEHHSNIVPWQFLQSKGLRIRYAKLTESGLLDVDDLVSKINRRTKILSVCHVSNVLGSINPVKELCSYARDNGIVSIVDGAQAVPHMPVNVDEIGCDFYAFSGHKMLGPSGIGGLAGKPEALDELIPFMGGGEMIRTVTYESSTYADVPLKFEAGTPNVEGAVGLSAAVNYLRRLGMQNVRKHEMDLMQHILNLEDEMSIRNLRSYGPRDVTHRGGVYAFNIGNQPSFSVDDLSEDSAVARGAIHPHDIAAELNKRGIAVRSGHHCAMPLMGLLGLAATARASFYIYNGKSDVDLFMSALLEISRGL